jgi:hypothetical protein
MALDPVAFIESIRARLNGYEPDYDWKPTTEPPKGFDRSLTRCAPPELPKFAGNVEEARLIIRQSIEEYLSIQVPNYMLLVKTLPGTGKTTAAVEIIDTIMAKAGRVGYAGPRHDFFHDVIAKTQKPEQWYEWLPRQAEDPDEGQIQTCRYTSQITTWLNKGYPAMDFCSGVCGWDYVNDRCLYHRQKLRKERVIYIQHQHVTLGHPMEFSILFGDESPLTAFTHEWNIPARWIMPPGMDPSDDIAEILNTMTAIAGMTDKPVMGTSLLEMLGGAQYVLDACEAYTIPADAIAYSGSIHYPEQAADKPYFHLPSLVHLLIREAHQAIQGIDAPQRVIVTKGHLTLLLRHSIHDKLPAHIIWLDATGRPEIYQKIFKREVKVIDAQPRMQGRIRQVIDRANGKQSLILDGKRTYRAGQAEQLIRKIIKDYGYQRPSVISYMDLVKDIEDIQSGHYYASRGTNVHEDADAMFMVGAPQPAIYDAVKIAKMIYFERDTAFKVSWVTREKRYRYIDEDGHGRQYPVSGFWDDPDLQAVLEALREDEILQAAHRGRPVNHPVDIWLLTNIPIDGLPPDELLTMREIMGAPERVDIFKWDKVQELMEKLDQISISDLVEIGVHYETASRYIDLIAGFPGWEKSVSRSKKGRPTKLVIRPNKRGLHNKY